ncbi:MAG: hypothetical protein PHU80_04545 [Kiritimatiellae bacterium]|nr:hypothetical protein [Kiritimatiellia bacterium]
MNTGTEINDTMPKTADDDAQPRGYRPRLSFYHANGKGSGSAARFEVVPASGDREGSVYLTLAQQKSVATGSTAQGNRQHATFDWAGRVTVKLNFDDLCQMLLVFSGQAAAIADGKGLYHDSRNMTTVINLNRNDETHPGVTLDISRRGKDESGQACRTRIAFNKAEAFGLGTVLEQALGLVAFGNAAPNSNV